MGGLVFWVLVIMKRALLLGFFMVTTTACQQTTLPLAKQPVHTVNPVPNIALTKHHTNDEMGVVNQDLMDQLSQSSWVLMQKLVSDGNSPLNHLNQHTRISFGKNNNDDHFNVVSTMGCNVASLSIVVDQHGNISRPERGLMSSTMMSCGQKTDDAESALMLFVANAKKLRITNNLLIIGDDGGTVLSFLKATSTEGG